MSYNKFLGSTSLAPVSVRIDDASSTVTYIGKAIIGTADSEAAWQIIKLSTSGTTIKLEYANKSEEYNQVWTNRTNLVYG